MMVLVLAVVVAASRIQTPGVTEAMKDNRVCYLFPVQTVARAEPDPAATVVNTYPPFSFALVKDAVGGWAYVEPTTKDAKTGDSGWIQIDKEYMVNAGALALLMRRDAVESKAWTKAVKLDLIRGRVRVGFTKEQVELAYTESPRDRGKPVRKATEETAAGVVETWIYPDATYTLKAGRVAKINRVE